MLLREDIRWGHQGSLVAALDREHHGRRRHDRFAGPHVALEQAVHRVRGEHVAPDLLDRPALRVREAEGKGGQEGLQHPTLGPVVVGLVARADLATPEQQEKLHRQKFVEGEPLTGGRGLREATWEVHRTQGLRERKQPELPADRIRQGLPDLPEVMHEGRVDHPAEDPR